MFRQIEDGMLVAGQIGPDDVAAAAAEGVTMIVNNRPDGEAPGQPPSSEIEAAAAAAGLGYRHIPITGGFPAAQVAEMAELLAQGGRTLAFCTSGTRSTWLWALARASRGANPDILIAQAAAVGYDLGPLRQYLS